MIKIHKFDSNDFEARLDAFIELLSMNGFIAKKIKKMSISNFLKEVYKIDSKIELTLIINVYNLIQTNELQTLK